MAPKTSSVIDRNAELAKLTTFRRTPQATRDERKGSVAKLADYRDGMLLAIKFSGRDHWERHLTGEELVHIIDGSATVQMTSDNGPPKSYELRTGMLALIPRGAWHRLLSSEGATQIAATPFPGEEVAQDVDDPDAVWRKAGTSGHEQAERGAASGLPTIIDIDAEAAKLSMFRGRTPRTTFAERKGSAVRLADYRDGLLLLSKSAGTGHWETHPEDELLCVLDGAMTVDIVEHDSVRSFTLGTGMMGVVPPGAWHRVRSADGATVLSAVVPGEHIDLDIDDPRTVAGKPS